MGWVDPWVGLGWVTRNGPMDNSDIFLGVDCWLSAGHYANSDLDCETFRVLPLMSKRTIRITDEEGRTSET